MCQLIRGTFVRLLHQHDFFPLCSVTCSSFVTLPLIDCLLFWWAIVVARKLSKSYPLKCWRHCHGAYFEAGRHHCLTIYFLASLCKWLNFFVLRYLNVTEPSVALDLIEILWWLNNTFHTKHKGLVLIKN